MGERTDEREVGPVWADDLGDVWVSTIYRESSAMEYRSPYFETMAFSHTEPGFLWQSSGMFEREARRQHDLAVRWFSRRAEGAPETVPYRVLACPGDNT